MLNQFVVSVAASPCPQQDSSPRHKCLTYGLTVICSPMASGFIDRIVTNCKLFQRSEVVLYMPEIYPVTRGT